MRLGMGMAAAGLAVVLAMTTSGTAAARDADAAPALSLPQQVDFTEGASNPRHPDQGPALRPRPRTGPADENRAERIRLAGDQIDYRLQQLGVRNGDTFRDKGRVYLFAADGERAVGYNLTRGEDGWERAGLSLDDGAFIGDAQAGVAWRKGDVQTSFGYTHREVKRIGRVGFDRDEGVVGLQVSFRPGGR